MRYQEKSNSETESRMVAAGRGVGEGIGKLLAPRNVGRAHSWDCWDPRGKGLLGCYVTGCSALYAQVCGYVSMLHVRKPVRRFLSSALVTMDRFQQGNDQKHFHLRQFIRYREMNLQRECP